MPQRLDLNNRVFDRLTVIKFAGISKTGSSLWLCQCECDGNTAVYYGSHLNNRLSRSCGCLRKEHARQMGKMFGQQVGRSRLKHGHSGKTKSKEYCAWQLAHRRCSNPNTKQYSDYGGRGIKVCDHWQGEQGFANFFADMGPKPEPKNKYSLDRIDNSGNYEPSNCKWATGKEQAANKRNKRIEQFEDGALIAELEKRGYVCEKPLMVAA